MITGRFLATGEVNDSGTLRACCRPSDVAGLAAVFYSGIPNRLNFDRMVSLAGGREDTPCRLPDGSIVDLLACQEWITRSVANGWSVGVMYERGWFYRRLTVARRRLEPEVQQLAPHEPPPSLAGGDSGLRKGGGR